MSKEVEIKALNVYPVKSCKAIGLDRAELTRQGLKYDRRWMVVRADGRFVTQRDNARLSQIEVALSDGGLRLSTAGRPTVRVPYSQLAGKRIGTRVWKDDCDTVDLGDEVSGWLTAAVASDQQLRLVKMAPDFSRGQSHPELLGADTNVFFADAAPVLIVDTASLERLNRSLQEKGEASVPMNRFRPNIVIEGLEAFGENRIARLDQDTYSLTFRLPCERCVVTTIDQEKSERHPRKEPFRTVRELNPGGKNMNQPVFGHYATVEAAAGTKIAVGQKLSAA